MNVEMPGKQFIEGDIEFYFKQFEDGFQAKSLSWLGDGALLGLGEDPENKHMTPTNNTVECEYKGQKCFFSFVDHSAGIFVTPESEFDKEVQEHVLIESSKEGIHALQQLLNNSWIEPDLRMKF